MQCNANCNAFQKLLQSSAVQYKLHCTRMTTFLNFCSIVQCTKNCLKTLPLGMNSNKDCPYITFITEEITSPCQSQILRQILSNLRCQGLTLSTAKNVYLLKNCLMINNQLGMTAGGAVCVMWGGTMSGVRKVRLGV